VDDQESLLSEPSLPTWPKQGTWGRGFAYELPTWVHPIYGNASSSSDKGLLPTPGAWLGRRPENATADPQRASSREHDGTRGKRSWELPDALATLLPTPTEGDSKASGSRNLEGSNAHMGVILTDAVRYGNSTAARLPTPQARDWKGRNQRNDSSCLPGALTNQPSDDGSTSSAEQPPSQLTIADA
jgi:hypothetical protein